MWMKQTIGHACGLMALLHSVFNLHGKYLTPGSELDVLRQRAIELAPAERAELLYNSAFLEEAHMEAAASGSTTAPSPRDENHHHFVAFVQKDNQVWELNGGMNGPLLRGTLEDEDLLSERGLAMTVQDYLNAAAEGGHGEMSIVAVAGKEAQ
jgi:ubiquitin carboxyl-terminal hydrolase L3